MTPSTDTSMSSSCATACSKVNILLEPLPENCVTALLDTNLLGVCYLYMPYYVISIMLNVPESLSATEQSTVSWSVVSSTPYCLLVFLNYHRQVLVHP
jgi:hypothetical protein